ncbi:Hsp33 family molecular chaperone HslO [Desulfitobacterium metallireducens]|uniref:33 kDa chaperonin n=1 Tax=Desulfitobacterium metallireducens DSM 15288 TaxID=871968 RepID=W0E9T9_9FIRM|nr:Hsp33 family molecular chaperone HslO [Desulfitobacterium metallireducens]AHF07630.1 molecular chaperone Hsp33 [Desulfitobacterium metallireducens DSM 15288]
MSNDIHDEIWLGTLLEGQARWVVAKTTDLVEEARSRHQTSPVATAALGRLMTASLLLASSLKGNESITIRLLGNGPLGGVVAVGNAQGEVRGYVHEPFTDLPLNENGKLDVAQAVGQGEFAVSKSLENGENFTSMVPLISGEIAEDLAHYLLNSEQIPSATLLGVLVERDYQVMGAGGMLIQLLPGASEECIEKIEEQINKLPEGISKIASESRSMEEMVQTLLGGLSYQVLEKRPAGFQCSCSKERVGATLISLGREGFKEILQDKQAELVCHFCNEHYQFDEKELMELYEQAK